jgi:hypothetical protein
MAVKCFADGVTPSGNLQTIWTIDGFDVLPEDSAGKPAMKDSCSFFDVCLLHTTTLLQCSNPRLLAPSAAIP